MQENLSRPELPLSLKKKRLQRIIMRSIACALLLAFFIFVIIIWGNRIFPATQNHHMGYTGLKIMFYIIVLLLPFIITGIPFKLIDKSWSGTITNIEIKENLGTTDNPKFVYVYPKQDLVLTVKTDDGKEIQKTVLSLVEKFEPGIDSSHIGKTFYHSHKYNIGDRVYKYYGFKYLYLVPESYQNSKICICCGSPNKTEDKSCWYCHSELISEETKNI